MERIKRVLWAGASVLALCVFAVMLLLWYMGGLKAKLCAAMRPRREAASHG